MANDSLPSWLTSIFDNTNSDDILGATGVFPKTTNKSGTWKGGAAKDAISGSAGADKFYGNGGHDFLYGAGGNDLLDGGTGNDTLYGGAGKDTIIGGDGNDWINGDGATLWGSKDVLTGGKGADTFEFGYESFGIRDVVKDFNTTQGDKIMVDMSATNFSWYDYYNVPISTVISATQEGNNTVLWVNTNASWDTMWDWGHWYAFATLENVKNFNVQQAWNSGHLDLEVSGW